MCFVIRTEQIDFTSFNKKMEMCLKDSWIIKPYEYLLNANNQISRSSNFPYCPKTHLQTRILTRLGLYNDKICNCRYNVNYRSINRPISAINVNNNFFSFNWLFSIIYNKLYRPTIDDIFGAHRFWLSISQQKQP